MVWSPLEAAIPEPSKKATLLPQRKAHMKLASWNVNSLKVRLPHLLDWLARHSPDAICLQETKLEDSKFPFEEIERAGYRCAWSGQKTYNGVAILSKLPTTLVSNGIPGFADEQKRVITATLGSGGGAPPVLSSYFPHSQNPASGKIPDKLERLPPLPELAGGGVPGHFPLAG